MNSIAFKSGYKYQLTHHYTVGTPIRPARTIGTIYISLNASGVLDIAKGYAWDGPSGIAFDTLNFMRGSMIHDALYQLVREGHLEPFNKDAIDRLLQAICIEDGMSRLRAWWVYHGVRLFADFAVRPSSQKPTLYAP